MLYTSLVTLTFCNKRMQQFSRLCRRQHPDFLFFVVRLGVLWFPRRRARELERGMTRGVSGGSSVMGGLQLQARETLAEDED